MVAVVLLFTSKRHVIATRRQLKFVKFIIRIIHSVAPEQIHRSEHLRPPAMTASSSVPSPAQQGSIVKITDEGIASYIEFPKDTIFMEALAQNASFNSGIAYVPVQRLVAGVKESHLYTIVPGMKEATHVAGPIAAPDGSTDVTIFGCHLTTAGILYLCAFNRNSILALDLTSLPVQAPPLKITCQLEIPHIASPNDVCVDPNDESILYVAGGTVTRPLLCCFLLPFSNSAYGMVYKIKFSDTSGSASTSFHITKQAGGLKTLAGVEVIDGKIVLAQLFNDKCGWPTTSTQRLMGK